MYFFLLKNDLEDKFNNYFKWICLFFLFHFSLVFAQKMISGKVYEEDSTTVLPFTYVINKNTGFGTVSDVNGNFSLKAKDDDTLIFSYTGYIKQYVPVMVAEKWKYKIIMKKNVYKLNMVNVNVLKYQDYEKDYMKHVMDKTQMPFINTLQSPITALYMQFSKKGKELQKLSKIFEDIFIQQQIEKKINPQILYQLTGDPNVDIVALRKFCGFYLSDYYILNHDGYDLYSKVMECYYRYKYEKEN